MIKRAVFYAKYLHNINQFIPKLSDCTPSLFASDDDLARAYHAVADLHEFANLDASQLSKGIIIDEIRKKKYRSKSALTLIDVVNIAKEAKASSYIEGYIDWLSVALKMKMGKNDRKELK